jgi:hypothetical protein
MDLLEIKFQAWFKDKFKKEFPAPLDVVKKICAAKKIDWVAFLAETCLQTQFYQEEFILAKNLWGTKQFISGKSKLIYFQTWGDGLQSATDSFLTCKQSAPAKDFVAQITLFRAETPKPKTPPKKPSPWDGGWNDQSSGQGSQTGGGVVVKPDPIKNDVKPGDLAPEFAKILGLVRTYIKFSLVVLSPLSLVSSKLRPIVAALRAILEILNRFK